MTHARQKVRVKLPGVRQMPIVRTDIHEVCKKGRAYTGQYRNTAGQTVKVWRIWSSDTWRPLS